VKKRKSPNRKINRAPVSQSNGDLLRRITIDPSVLVGKPIIRGMRISVEQILNLLGQGMTHREVLREYPVLEEADIKAALLYAHDVIATEKVYRVGRTS